MFLLKYKYELSTHIQSLIQLIVNQHNVIIKIIKIDNGHDFSLPTFYTSKCIHHQSNVLKLHNKMVEYGGKITIS